MGTEVGERRRRVGAWAAVVLWTCVILLFSGDPFAADETRGWLERLWLAVGLPPPGPLALYLVRKGAHVLEYGVLGGLIFWASLPGRRVPRALAAALLLSLAVAAADELHQSTLPRRTGTVRDVGLDLAGATAGALLVAAVRRAIRSA
jgi:VanZ family protein